MDIFSTPWYSLDVNQTLEKLNSSSSGLSEEEATLRLEKYGPNRIEEEKQESPWKLLLGQFTDLLIIILIIAAIISASIGEIVEAIAIIVIVILAGVLGFVQEFRASKAIAALKQMAAPHANVIRGGKEKDVLAENLVPGDILVVSTGNRLSADARIIESKNLRVEEAALTGESVPINKRTDAIKDEKVSLGDRKNMLFMGTAVSYGRGLAVVTGTGKHSEFGKIAGLLSSTEVRRTPLQENLDQLGQKIGIFSVILAALMSFLGILYGYSIIDMFVWGVALAVAVIPEALPAVVTISLALGVRRMVKRRALIRKLPAVETLGATNIICSDKTGTLTQDQMTIKQIFTGNDLIEVTGTGYKPEGEFRLDGNVLSEKRKDIELLLKGGSLCSDAGLLQEQNEWTITGDPTEAAIVVAAKKYGIDTDALKKDAPRIDEVPFSSERKRMTTVNKLEGKLIAFSKGAPEIILEHCSKIQIGDAQLERTDELTKKILEAYQSMAENALRVLGVAYNDVPSENIDEESVETNLTFLGLVGMIDPPRLEVKDSIKTCERAGIKPIMITGDHKVTAVAIAKELGILKEGKALSGYEIEDLSDEEFHKVADETEVYARISPEHKLKIVNALMDKGNIVAMTGDGVNDAPSLKKSDIGVAMGITGTDVSKEAADMILTDDNFASIVAAVEEGRSIFENIRKYLVYLLSGNMGAVIALVIALIAELPLPLYAVQILFINFIMDGLIAIALGVEPPEPGIMDRPPRNVKEGILSNCALWYIGSVSVWISMIILGIFIWALNTGHTETEAVTMFFMTLVFARLFNGFNFRSMVQSVFKMNFFTNKALLMSGLFSLLLTLAIVSTEFLNKVFHTTPVGINEWLMILGLAFSVIPFGEIMKVIKRRGKGC